MVSFNFKKTFQDIVSGKISKKNIISKEEASKKYNIPLVNIVNDSLSVKELIKVKTMNNNFQIIKFHNDKSIIKTNYEILDNDIVNHSYLLKILMSLNFEFFINIYSDKESEKYPEVKILKPLIQDANGVLNIEKLAKVLEENKDKLSKYLD